MLVPLQQSGRTSEQKQQNLRVVEQFVLWGQRLWLWTGFYLKISESSEQE